VLQKNTRGGKKVSKVLRGTDRENEIQGKGAETDCGAGGHMEQVQEKMNTYKLKNIRVEWQEKKKENPCEPESLSRGGGGERRTKENLKDLFLTGWSFGRAQLNKSEGKKGDNLQ